MGRMLLFVVMGIGTLFLIFNRNNINDDNKMTSNVYSNFDYVNAGNISKAGIELAVSKLSKDPNWGGINDLKFDQGILDVKVSDTKSKYPDGPDMGLTSAKEIVSKGIVREQVKIIKVVVNLPGNSGSSPDFLNYAVMSGQDLTLNGNMTITDDGNNNWNSNIHANGTLRLNGGNNLVSGFGTFSGSPAPINNNADIKTFIPNQNPDGKPVYEKTDQVKVPDFKAEDYKKYATIIEPGNKIIDKNTSLGSKDNPVIYYVNGGLTIRANVTFTGYGIFIVNGPVKTEGNLLISSPDHSANNLAIYAEGDIHVDQNSQIYAQLFSNGNIIFNGNSVLHGLAVSKSSITLNGNSNDIYYKPTGANLTKIFQTGSGKPSILSYYE